MNSNKHLTLLDRHTIEDCLTCGMFFKQIAKKIGKDQTTVSKEIKKHIVRSGQCSKKDSEGHFLTCPSLSKPPFVCNACPKRSYQCGFQKQRYYADFAHNSYLKTLSSSRQSIALNKQEFYDDDAIISQKLSQGQHLYHIFTTNNLHCSLSSIYRYFNLGYFSTSSIDLPRKVKFASRKKIKEDYVPRKLKIGRSFEDFTNFKNSNKISHWVEMDTVVGRMGGKVILTLDFTFCNFIFGFLLDNKSSAQVASKIKSLKQKLLLSDFSFGDIFPVILTDNGGEFSNIFAIENDLNGNIETRLFFCDPYKSCQKPFVENTHTQLRNILPKETSFDDLTQDNLNIIFSHINSAKKSSLNGKSAYELFCFMYSKKLANIFGIQEIPAEDVIQNTNLLKLLKN